VELAAVSVAEILLPATVWSTIDIWLDAPSTAPPLRAPALLPALYPTWVVPLLLFCTTLCANCFPGGSRDSFPGAVFGRTSGLRSAALAVSGVTSEALATAGALVSALEKGPADWAL
jgi:hypothetical protein